MQSRFSFQSVPADHPSLAHLMATTEAIPQVMEDLMAMLPPGTLIDLETADLLGVSDHVDEDGHRHVDLLARMRADGRLVITGAVFGGPSGPGYGGHALGAIDGRFGVAGTLRAWTEKRPDVITHLDALATDSEWVTPETRRRAG